MNICQVPAIPTKARKKRVLDDALETTPKQFKASGHENRQCNQGRSLIVQNHRMMGVGAQRAAVTFMRAMRNCPTVVRVPALKAY